MDTEKRLSDSRRLMLQGNDDAAVKILREHMEASPEDAEAASLLARAYLRSGRAEEAEETALKGMETAPEHAGLLRRLAEICRDTGRVSQAWRYFNRAQQKLDGDERSECLLAMGALEEQGLADKTYIDAPKGKKTVLVIAAIFPPLCGSGVWRTLKLVKYLRTFGWEPVVVTGAHEEGACCGALLDELPDDIRVIRIPFPEVKEAVLQQTLSRLSEMTTAETFTTYLGRLAALGLDDRFQAMCFPEPIIFWAHHVVNTVARLIDLSRVDLIYTTSGPYSDHFAGYFLKIRTRLPWVADFRDEWSHNPVVWPDKSSLMYRICLQVERVICEYADRVVCVAPPAVENYVRLGVPRDKIACITNGYDEEDFEGISPPPRRNDRFTIVHNGFLYYDRTPLTVLEAMAALIRRGDIPPDRLFLDIGRTDDDRRWKEKAAELGLTDMVQMDEGMPHRQSLLRTAAADMLLLVLGPTPLYKNTCTGKLFEYLRFKKPILCLGPEGNIAGRMIGDAGRSVDFADAEGIAAYILALYRQWDSGESLTVSVPDVAQYDRRRTAGQHAAVFDDVVAAPVSLLTTEGRELLARRMIEDGQEVRIAAELHTRLYRQHDPDSVLRLFEYWKSIGEPTGTGYLLNAAVLNAQGRFKEALENHQHAIVVDPLLADARYREHAAKDAYGEATPPCIGCGSPEADVVYVTNQSVTSSGLGVLNPIRVWKRCRRCGLKYAEPQPSPAALAEYYRLSAAEQRPGGKAGDIAEQNNEEQYRKMAQARLQNIERLLGKKDKLLDVGAGVGTFVAEAQQLGVGCHGRGILSRGVRQGKGTARRVLNTGGFLWLRTGGEVRRSDAV